MGDINDSTEFVHINRCRLCIVETHNDSPKILITAKIRSKIFDLNLQIIFTRSYSNFICVDCHRSLQQLSNFRTAISEKQRKLAKYLCRIDTKNHSGLKDVKLKTEVSPSYVECIVVKTERIDEDNFETQQTPDLNYQEDESYFKIAKFEDAASDCDFPEIFSDVDEGRSKSHTTKSNQWKDRLIPCPLCGKSLKNSSLSYHIRHVHEKKTNFFCDLCGKGVFLKHQLRSHMFVHIPRELREKPFECTMCPKKFHSSALLKEHLRFVHSMEPNFCKFEVKRLSENLKSFRKIMKTECDIIKTVRVKKNWKEAAEQIVPCPTCGKFLKQKSLSQHYKQVHEGKKNCICDFCNRGFYSKHQLATHMFVHMSTEHRVKPFQCDLCHKSFHSLKLLKEHVKYTHLSKLKLWKCKCGKAYNNPGSLRQHKRIIHDNVKKVGAPRQCEQCGKNYSNTTELNEHIKVVHTEGGQGTHMCADCGLTFDYARQFTRHLLTHQEKTILCEHPGCGRKYVNRKVLVNHQKQVHIAKNFVCSAGACTKAFQTNSMLIRHVAQIHEKRRDDCPVEGCKYTNGRRCYMKVHLKTHTELEPDVLNAFIANIKWMNLV